MQRVFLLLLLVSSSLCAGNNNSNLGTGTETSLAACQPDTCALLSEVAAMREKLETLTQARSVLGQNLNAMMQKMATLEANMQSYKSQAEELWKANQAQDKQLNAILSANSSTKVAFTAFLGKSVGPFQQDTPVKYQQIISNIGNSYNPATGIFTARTRGLYYFSYTMFNNISGQINSVVSLMRNGQQMVSTWDTVGSDINDSASNAAVLQLEAGDSVFVKLHANRLLYDDGMCYNTFSGFLLFTL